MTARLDLRLTAAERLAFERAAGSLSVPAWARAVLCATAGLTAMPKRRGTDVVPRKRRGPKPLPVGAVVMVEEDGTEWRISGPAGTPHP